MIIQSLHHYYERIKDDPDEEIPLFGFSREKIHFALVLSREGNLIDILDLRIQKGNKLVPTVLTVPDGGKKASGINPSFLWGTTGYVIGKDNKEHKDPLRPKKMFFEFKKLQHELGDKLDDQGMDAILKFLDSWNPDNIEQSFIWRYWDDGLAGANVVCKLENEMQYIHDHHTIQNKWIDYYSKSSSYTGCCLVTGKEQSIARLHPSIKGVRGAQSSGASIVSFNLNAFCSYDKEQSYNAPVSEVVAFNYTTILNYLLRQESRQKVIIGDTTVVFWAEGNTPVIGFLSEILGTKTIDDLQNTGSLSKIRLFLEAVRDGKKPDLEGTDQMKFFILGLSPNASRLSIRFWYKSTVEDIVHKIGMHFKDMIIEKKYEDDPDYPSVWRIILECAVQRKVDNIPPLLAGSLMQSIVTGVSYPAMLLTSIVNRIRADQSINYIRVSMIKAYLVRINRLRNINKKEVTMSLDLEQKNIAYLLGRLFALLEKVQKDAIPGANTTIKDRFFGSASATPASVFPILLRRGQHHIEKSEYGSYIDKQMEEIIKDVHNFPRHLNIEDQGMFAIGYYHQKNTIYKKADKED